MTSLLRCQRLVLFAIVVAVLIGVLILIVRNSATMYLMDKMGIRSGFLPADMRCKDNCSPLFTPGYVIVNEKLCGSDDVFLFVAVISAFSNANRRNTIRTTWGAKTDPGVKVMFFLGSGRDVTTEVNKYGDIVQLTTEESYRLLKYKSVSILHWVNTYCPQAKFVLKTDDDSFNYLPNYASFLQTMNGVTFVGGYCFTVQPHRSNGSRYYDGVFTGSMYPIFCHGAGYILSQSAVKKILHVSPSVVMIPMEDAYITGLCRVAADIPYVQIPGADVKQTDATACAFRNGLKTVAQTNSPGMQQLWQESYKVNTVKDSCLSLFELSAIFTIISFIVILFICIKLGSKCHSRKTIV